MSNENMKLKGAYRVVCTDKYGCFKWEDTAQNIITDEGLNYILGNGLGNEFMLLKGAGSVDASDTLASHAGWSEITDYLGGRPGWEVNPAADQEISNDGSPAEFEMTGSATVDGAGITSANTGTSGTLVSVASFAGGSKSVDDGDTLSVTYTITAASS